MTLLTTAIGLWVLLLASRGTPIGQALERWLVVRPAAALSRIRRHTLLAAAALALVALACWWTLGHEGMLMFGMGMPELGSVLALIDLGTLFDVAVVLVAAGSTGGWKAIRTATARWRPRARVSRARRTGTPRTPPANDEGDGPAFALAAA